MKALDLLRADKKTDITQKAERIIVPIKRHLQKTFLDPLVEKIEGLEEFIINHTEFKLDHESEGKLEIIQNQFSKLLGAYAYGVDPFCWEEDRRLLLLL